jgi:hypothetical protein
MNIEKNEHGYALLSVLLIVTLFMIFFLSFMGQAFSSVKQNQAIEKHSQSVALAEMGIKHYQVAVQNLYSANLATVSNEVKQQISLDRQPGKTLQSNAYYVGLGVSKMKTAIKNGLLNEKLTVSIDGKSNSNFSIHSIDYFETTKDNKILIKVVGEENGKKTILSSEMNFAPDITGLSGSGSSIPPSFNSISEPTVTSNCKDPLSVGLCTSVLITSATKTFNDKLNNSSNRTIYSKGDLILNAPSNANNMSYMSIHSDKSLTIGGNVQNATNVTIETIGNLDIIGQFKLQSGTTVLVNGNVNITKILKLETGSKMCVNGTIETKKTQEKGGLLIVKSKVSASDWASKCGTSGNIMVDWNDKVYNNVNYEY